jgi:hypothetical protein
MDRPSCRHLTFSAALVLVVLTPGAACGGEAVSPLPVDAQSTATSGAATASASRTASPTMSPSAQKASPTRSPPAKTTSRFPRPRRTTALPSPVVTRSPACLGAVVYTVRTDADLARVKSLCLAVGGVLRVDGTGPGMVSADPPEKVSQFYEAGIEDCRFLSPGTITVTIVTDQQTFTITVVVI